MKSLRRIFAVLVFGLGAAQWLHAEPFAYISHQNGVSVVDLASRALIAEVPGNLAFGVAIRGDVNHAYVADRDKVTVVEMAAQAPIATAGYPTTGGTIVMRPGRPDAYILTDHCSNTPGTLCTTEISSVIRMFNTDTNTLGDTFTDLGSSFPASHIAFSADGLLLFITRVNGTLAIFNADTRQLITTVALGSDPRGMAVDPARNLLYVAENGGGNGQSVAIVDLGTRALVGRIAVGIGPQELAISGSRLYVTNTTSNTVSVVDLDRRATIGTVTVGRRPMGIDITNAGDEIVVANNGDNTASLIDTVSLNIIATVGVGPGPMAIGRFIGGVSAPRPPDILSGLWYNPAEPGWGVHVAHRGNKIFAAWFTYDGNGAPKWYVSSDCGMNSQLPTVPGTGQASCTGNIYETTGPRFFSDPFSAGAVAVHKDGLFQMVFQDKDHGSMSVVTDTAAKTFPLQRQVFRVSGPAFQTDYTDLWWNPAESGWGIGITQQFGVMFLTWFAYDDTGTAVWYVASNCAVNAAGNGCTGDLYRMSGPPDQLHNAFDVSRVKPTNVGSITASFNDANTGTIRYTVDGKSGSKNITRQIF